jgi:hypothetical protein
MRAIFLLLLIALAGGGYFTRPNVERHQTVVETLAGRGLANPPPQIAAQEGSPRELLVDDYYVATRSRLTADGVVMLDCWGAFTRFFCTRPGGAAQQAAPEPQG